MTAADGVEVHLLAGEAGCDWARRHKAVAVVVDALRASATITLLLQRGAGEIVVVKEVDEAYAYRQADPEAVLVGERGGLKVPGFDFGNSPTEIQGVDLRGRRVVFTSTTGAQRLVDCLGASAIVVGTPINASAVAQRVAVLARAAAVPIVIIPAGLATDPEQVAQEDWLGAVVVAAQLRDIPLHRASEPAFRRYHGLLQRSGLLAGFLESAHGRRLVQLGFAADVRLCAQVDLIADVVPMLTAVVPLPCGGQGVRIQRGNGEYATPL
jgi:2-phosphosulfolactate phosphatase